jgi:hypothetical protein
LVRLLDYGVGTPVPPPPIPTLNGRKAPATA